MPFFETSALEGTCVTEAFVTMAQKVNEIVSKRIDASLSPGGQQRMRDASMSPAATTTQEASSGGSWGIRASVRSSVRGIGDMLTKPLGYFGSASPAASPAKPPG